MKVLVGIDGSEHSIKALTQAAAFAQATDGQLLLLRVLNPIADCADVTAPTLSEAVELLEARWQSELDALAGGAGVHSASAEVRIKQRDESTAEALVRAASEWGAQLVALGTRGTGIARRALLGSVATQVLQRSGCPLMLVGERIAPPADTQPYRVLIATDGCPPSETLLTEFTRTVEGVPAHRLAVTAVHVWEPSYASTEGGRADAAQQLEAFAARLPQDLGPGSALLLDEGHHGPTEPLLAYAQETGADAIWMATQGHSWPRQVFLGSVALRTVEHAHIPVVLVRAHEA